MFKIDDENKITLTRGDTARATVAIMEKAGECDLVPYVPQEGDVITFAVKRNEYIGVRYTHLKDAEPLIKKTVPIDTMTLELTPEDTKDLGFGTYLYDIEITMADGTVDTFIEDALLDITTEVH